MKVGNHVSISGYSAVSDQTVQSLTISGKAYINHVTCTDSLTCSGKADIDSSHLHSVRISGYMGMRQSTADEITVSGHLRAEDCPMIGNIRASGQLHLVNCAQINDIRASGALSLLHTNVQGDVIHTGRELQMTDSRIEGKLTCSDQKISINQSYVNEIVVKGGEKQLVLFGNVFSFNIQFGNFKFFRHYGTTSEPVVELSGPNCVVHSISFEKGISGRVILKNGAKVMGPVLRGTIVEA